MGSNSRNSSPNTKTSRSGRTIRKPAKHGESYRTSGVAGGGSATADDANHPHHPPGSGPWKLYHPPPLFTEAPQEAMDLYQKTFGNLQVPPGWIGDVELAEYMSWQRHLQRERDYGYYKGGSSSPSSNNAPPLQEITDRPWKVVGDDGIEEQTEDTEWIVV